MQNFFKSKRFLLLVFLLFLSVFFMLRAAYTQTAQPLAAKVVSFVTEPLQKGFAKAYEGVYETFYDVIHASSISDENEKLREENARLLGELAEKDRLQKENDSMKEFLGIKTENPDFSLEMAQVIGRDASERFYSFTLDKGSKDGITKNAPCITSEGLVGIVTEVGSSYCKVSTILDSTVEVGVTVLESSDIGITEGNTSLALEGNLRLSYLPRDTKTKAGDTVFTTGIGGIFPEGILVGKVKEVLPDSQGLTLNAVVDPLMDIQKVTEVMVIKDFAGKEEKGE